ncbi:MAG: membrane protein insertase YidC [Chitinivibrionales bacterium]|nr:membrane protein insertase YidC [Chitinivibrionales bacterium]
MNRNTLLAFALILLAIMVFNHPKYYEIVLGREHPSKQAERAARERRAREEKEAAAPAEQSAPEESKVAGPPKTSDQQRPGLLAVEGGATAEAGDSTETAGVDAPGLDTVWVETEKLVVGIAERGARIVSVRTKEYRDDPTARNASLEENPYIELVSVPETGGANLAVNNEAFDKAVFSAAGDTTSYVLGAADSLTVSFEWEGEDGGGLQKRFRFSGDSYVIGLEVASRVLDGKKVRVGWECGIVESEDGGGGKSARYDIRKVHLYDGKNVSHISEKKPGKSEEAGYYKWVGLTSKYFLVSMVSDSTRDGEVIIEAFEEEKDTEEPKKKREKTINYGFAWQRFASGPVESYTLYIGPSSLGELKEQDVKLEKVLFGGWKWFFRADVWFPALCEFVLWLLIVLHGIVKDYGVVIIVLTILSRVITYPLTQSSMKSMNRMRELQPKVTAIREKHKGNPQQMNQKMMALYKEEGVNPLNPGCLPMFLQLPIFIALFIVLRKAIELRGAGTWVIPWVNDLSKPEVLPIPFINPLPFEIPLYGNNIALLPIVMALLTYFQNKATIKDPNQKAMIYFMPIFMLVLFNSFPSGLVLYWTFSSALQLVQQFVLNKLKKGNAAPAGAPARASR